MNDLPKPYDPEIVKKFASDEVLREHVFNYIKNFFYQEHEASWMSIKADSAVDYDKVGKILVEYKRAYLKLDAAFTSMLPRSKDSSQIKLPK